MLVNIFQEQREVVLGGDYDIDVLAFILSSLNHAESSTILRTE